MGDCGRVSVTGGGPLPHPHSVSACRARCRFASHCSGSDGGLLLRGLRRAMRMASAVAQQGSVAPPVRVRCPALACRRFRWVGAGVHAHAAPAYPLRTCRYEVAIPAGKVGMIGGSGVYAGGAGGPGLGEVLRGDYGCMPRPVRTGEACRLAAGVVRLRTQSGAARLGAGRCEKKMTGARSSRCESGGKPLRRSAKNVTRPCASARCAASLMPAPGCVACGRQ